MKCCGGMVILELYSVCLIETYSLLVIRYYFLLTVMSFFVCFFLCVRIGVIGSSGGLKIKRNVIEMCVVVNF